jgi:hypothetical protein
VHTLDTIEQIIIIIIRCESLSKHYGLSRLYFKVLIVSSFTIEDIFYNITVSDW